MADSLTTDANLVIAGPVLRQVLGLPDDCELPYDTIVPIRHKSIEPGSTVAATFTGCCGETKFHSFMPTTAPYRNEFM